MTLRTEPRPKCVEAQSLAVLLRQAIPKPITPDWVDNAVVAGMLPKSVLADGGYYAGRCRNANIARWRADRECFTYLREKFGSVHAEEIFHPEDDNGFDLFLPTLRVL
jgi:hypothetical protein